MECTAFPVKWLHNLETLQGNRLRNLGLGAQATKTKNRDVLNQRVLIYYWIYLCWRWGLILFSGIRVYTQNILWLRIFFQWIYVLFASLTLSLRPALRPDSSTLDESDRLWTVHITRLLFLQYSQLPPFLSYTQFFPLSDGLGFGTGRKDANARLAGNFTCKKETLRRKFLFEFFLYCPYIEGVVIH
jgi:hypothetical protein